MSDLKYFLDKARKISWLGVEFILKGGFPKGKWIPFSDLHRQIQETIDKVKKEVEAVKLGLLDPNKAKRGALIQTARDHSKCVVDDTLIALADGSQKKIVDCKVGDKVLSVNDDLELCTSVVHEVYDNGIKDVYEVRTKSGKCVIVTENHSFLTLEGWKSLETGLSLQDKVFVFGDYKYLDGLISIKYKGKQHTYGLDVYPYHNHITNDIITHNTTSVLGRVLWELGNNANLLIKIVCASEEQAKKRIAFLRRHIETNKNLHLLFPHLKPQPDSAWSTTQLYVERDLISPDPSVEAAGILGSFTGSHARLIIFDDIVDFRNAFVYPENLKKIEQAVKENWLNILSEDGYFVAIYTAWTKDDITLKMEKQTDLYYVFKRVIDDDLNPIWEAKYNREALIRKREEIGEEAFARQFQGKIVVDRSNLFNKQSIEACKDPNIEFGEYPDNCLFFTGVDLGHRKRDKSPRTVIFTLAVTEDGKRLPVSIVAGNFSPTETGQLIINEFLKYNPEVIKVENNGYQESILDIISLIDPSLSLPVEGCFTGSQKNDIRVGLPSLATEFDRKLWIIPAKNLDQHPSHCDCGLCLWLRELESYPHGLTDTVMASWFALQGVRQVLGTDTAYNVRVIELDLSKP